MKTSELTLDKIPGYIPKIGDVIKYTFHIHSNMFNKHYKITEVRINESSSSPYKYIISSNKHRGYYWACFSLVDNSASRLRDNKFDNLLQQEYKKLINLIK